MSHLIQLHDNLDKVAKQHIALTSVFKEFAHFVKDCVLAPSIANHNISVSLHLDQGFFTTSFANRTVSFVFTSLLESEECENLIGNVTCYLKKDFPEPKHIKFGGFNFNENGHTNLKIPDSNETVHITNDLGTFFMALHFIHQSLSK